MSAMQKRYWESLSDEELVGLETTTDDPENLPGLVTEVPPGDEEVYVEYKYDLTKSGRDEFSCVHGHHRHLKGFVMRKGRARFLVGWMCGKSIYGEDFDAYTADFDAAIIKRDTLRRVKDIKVAIDPFSAWLQEVTDSNVFDRFDSAREQVYEHLQWVHDNFYFIAHADVRARRSNFPERLFDEKNDPELDWNRAVAEFHAIAMRAVSTEEWAEKNLAHMKRAMEGLLKRFERVLAQLKELETFFQPEVLALICEYANVHDNPKKRTYQPGLLSITCKRGKDKTVVCMPRSYKVPSTRAIDAFRVALGGLQFLKSSAA